jgi:hypothetical protein
LEELSKTLEKVPACGVLLEVNTSLEASPEGNKAIREMSEFYPFGKFKLVGNDVLILSGCKSVHRKVWPGNIPRSVAITTESIVPHPVRPMIAS